MSSISARPVSHKRDIAIDSLRGIAIILMVAGHVIGATGSDGLRVSEDSYWRNAYLILEDVRMPLFTALSGWIYAIRPMSTPVTYGSFVWRKVRRLLVPLFTVGTAFTIMRAVTPGTNSDSSVADLWRVWVYGTGHFWFLQAIFLIFLVVGIADAFGLLQRPAVLLGAVLATSVIAVAVQLPSSSTIFSIDGFVALLPFFLLGYFLNTHESRLVRIRWVSFAVAVVLLTTKIGVVTELFSLTGTANAILGVAVGIATISGLLLFRAKFSWLPLAVLGYFSFAIYLLHIFGTAPSRIVLTQLGIDSLPIQFLFALAVGLALPILFETTLGKIRWISWAFLGQKPYTRPTW